MGICLVGLAVGICVLLFVGHDYQASLLRVDCMLLKGYHDAWLKAGAPVDGEALTKFREGRPPEIVPSSRLFVIGGTPFFTQLASTNLRGREGTLYITSNGVMLLEAKPGVAKVVPEHKH
jgi:hypothetical protein